MYHVSLHLKSFRLSVMFNNPFVVFLAIDGVSSCPNGFLRAMSNASLSSDFVYNLITSRDVFFSLGASLKLSKISFASSELLSLFVPSIFSSDFFKEPCSGYIGSYQAMRAPIYRKCSIYAHSPTLKPC